MMETKMAARAPPASGLVEALPARQVVPGINEMISKSKPAGHYPARFAQIARNIVDAQMGLNPAKVKAFRNAGGGVKQRLTE